MRIFRAKSATTLILAFFTLGLLPINCQEHIQIPAIDKQPVLEYLESNLWTDQYAYDAAHFLMVPMHFAFQTNDSQLIDEFDSFFTRFIKDKESFLEIESELKRLQFNYLISQYLTLKCDSGENQDDLLYALTEYLTEELNHHYYKAKVINWKYPDNDNYEFEGNRNRIFWKMTSDMDPSYYKKSIIDHELFLIGIAADLSFYFDRCKSTDPGRKQTATLAEINTLAYIIFSTRFQRYESGLVFQPGYYYRHRDYKYAGCLTIDCVEKGPSQIKDIAPDTSHSLRLPLVLSSLQNANENDPVLFSFYRKTKEGLAKQMNRKVIDISNQGRQIRITNYLDGRNGFYRWDYDTNKGDGYGPYEVGETFKLGWWSFLDDAKIRSVYAQIAVNLHEKVPEEYQFKDKTTRARNPIVEGRFENGLYTTITAMASQLKSD